MRTLVVLIGLPFSGKTTYAERIVKDCAQRGLGEVLVIKRDNFLDRVNADPQMIRELLGEVGADVDQLSPSERHGIVQSASYQQALTQRYVRFVRELVEQSQAQTIVVDGVHLSKMSRSFVAGLNGFHRTAVVFMTSPEVCIERLRRAPMPLERGVRSTVTPDMIRRLAKKFEPVGEGEGFEELISV